MIKVAAYSRLPHHFYFHSAMIAGMSRHGIAAEHRRCADHIHTDVAIVWGEHERLRAAPYARHVLVMERGYFHDRTQWTSCGWNGLNGRADFVNEWSPPDRWNRVGAELQPWHTEGEYILLLGQVEGDASLMGVNINAWYQAAVHLLSKFDYPVVFRPHPVSHKNIVLDGAETVFRPSLLEQLAGAAWAVTFNSNSAVDAVIAGCPVVAWDQGSMARPVAGRHISEQPVTPDRTEWARKLAYTQWTHAEIEQGDAWEHLWRAPYAV